MLSLYIPPLRPLNTLYPLENFPFFQVNVDAAAQSTLWGWLDKMWKLLKTLRDCRAEPASLCARVDGLERRRRRRWHRSRSRLWGWFRRCDAVNGGYCSMCCDHVLASLLAASLFARFSHGWQAFSKMFSAKVAGGGG